MNHLSPEQLSALLDAALEGRAREGSERHLAECAECRDALAALAAQDEALVGSLAHDPGEAYFASFPDRVSDRLRAESLAGAQRRESGWLAGLFRSPRRLALVSAAATVVVGAGIVLMTAKETQFPGLRPSPAFQQAERAAEEAPQTPPSGAVAPAPEAAAPSAGAPQPEGKDVLAKREEAPSLEAEGGSGVARDARVQAFARDPGAGRVEAPTAAEQTRMKLLERESDRVPAPTGARPPSAEAAKSLGQRAAPAPGGAEARPGRLIEVRKNELGEDVPVRPQELQRFRPARPAPPPAPADQPVRVRKRAWAEPMRQSQQSPTQPDQKSGLAPAPQAEVRQEPLAGAQGEIAAGRVCGDVRDPLGRPVPGAQVVVRGSSASATADRKGHFCVAAPVGERTLTVMAVGYRATELSVRVAPGEQYASVRLEPAELAWGKTKALYRGGAEAPRDTRGGVIPGAALRLGSTGIKGDDPFAALDAPARGAVEKAQRLSASATRQRTAASHQAAAEAWEQCLALVSAGPAAREAGYHAARECYQAWEIAPAPGTRECATRLIRRFLAAEPAGPRRAEAEKWLRQVER